MSDTNELAALFDLLDQNREPACSKDFVFRLYKRHLAGRITKLDLNYFNNGSDTKA